MMTKVTLLCKKKRSRGLLFAQANANCLQKPSLRGTRWVVLQPKRIRPHLFLFRAPGRTWLSVEETDDLARFRNQQLAPAIRNLVLRTQDLPWEIALDGVAVARLLKATTLPDPSVGITLRRAVLARRAVLRSRRSDRSGRSRLLSVDANIHVYINVHTLTYRRCFHRRCDSLRRRCRLRSRRRDDRSGRRCGSFWLVLLHVLNGINVVLALGQIDDIRTTGVHLRPLLLEDPLLASHGLHLHAGIRFKRTPAQADDAIIAVLGVLSGGQIDHRLTSTPGGDTHIFRCVVEGRVQLGRFFLFFLLRLGLGGRSRRRRRRRRSFRGRSRGKGPRCSLTESQIRHNAHRHHGDQLLQFVHDEPL